MKRISYNRLIKYWLEYLSVITKKEKELKTIEFKRANEFLFWLEVKFND